MKRLHNLDYLRGLAACGIMMYHFFSWSYGMPEVDSIPTRIGLYGVSIFYILSGLTMYLVYNDSLTLSRRDLSAYATKRFLRIYPLLWLATFATLVLSRQVPDAVKLTLNLTGLFGLVKPTAYYATGVWSIGNELVFYLCLPVFLFLKNNYKLWFGILSLIVLAVYVYFTCFHFDSAISVGAQWADYINPLNHMLFFLGGFLIGWKLENVVMERELTATLLVLGIALFLQFPSGTEASLIVGAKRMVMTFSCFLIVVAFYKMQISPPKAVDTPLRILGETSYSIYLLHPLVFGVSKLVLMKFLGFIPNILSLAICIATALTLAVSYFSYRYFEKPFMRLRKHSSK